MGEKITENKKKTETKEKQINTGERGNKKRQVGQSQ